MSPKWAELSVTEAYKLVLEATDGVEAGLREFREAMIGPASTKHRFTRLKKLGMATTALALAFDQYTSAMRQSE